MNTIKSIEDRRSIRKFKNEDISDKVVMDILNCGRLAPSAKNRQPWNFVVLKGEYKNNIAKIMCDNNNSEQEKYDKEILKCNNSVNLTVRVIKEAPILVLIFKEKDENWNTGDNLSIGACVENMCLRAVELGLGTLWIRDVVYASEKIAEYIGKNDMELNCALSIGVPNENPKARTRKKLSEIVEWRI